MKHGGDLTGAALEAQRPEEVLIDFSSNINPLGIHENVINAVIGNLGTLSAYPDPKCRALKSAIAAYEQVPEEYILCGNGGADLIYRFAYAMKGSRALLPAPTFGEYEEALRQAGSELGFYFLNESLEMDERILELLSREVRILFLCNPNNPTGILTSKDLLLQILAKSKKLDITVFADECFLDFTEEGDAYSLKGELAAYPNLVILKSFTKMFAIPGLRLGYLMTSDAGLLRRISQAGQPWSVSALAQAAGLEALKDTAYVKDAIAYVTKERAYLSDALKGFGMHVFPGKANYLCFQKMGEHMLYEKLLSEGIVIRKCSNYRGLDESFYRVAVNTHEKNVKLVEALERVIG